MNTSSDVREQPAGESRDGGGVRAPGMDTSAEEVKLLALQLRVVVEEIMVVRDTALSASAVSFFGNLLRPPGEAFAWLRERLSPFGFVPMVSRERGEDVVRMVAEAREGKTNPFINLVLFLLTVGSTLLVGAGMVGVNIISHPERFAAGIPFACSILAILLVHEFGHYLMSAFHGVRATLPYFIPFPNIFGTLGAVIKTRSHIPDRRSLLDIGAAGPICGFAVALVAFGIGLHHSEVVETGPLARRGDVWQFGDSIIVSLMTRLVKGRLIEGQDIWLSPVAYAGWVGLLVTAFNLMPVGQLDGGHIVYALAGRRHSLVAKAVIAALIVMGFYWQPWWIWVLLIMIMGAGHAPPLDDVTPLDAGRKLVAFAALAIFAVCLVPVPVRIGSIL